MLGKPITGAQFVIEAFVENEHNEKQLISLYKSTDDVTSMEQLIPGKLTIKNDDGKFNINNIRIENLNSYLLQITEITAPDGYTLLKEPIVMKVKPKIVGENDDAKLVVDTIEIISGDNNGLVKFIVNSENEEIKEEETIKSNDKLLIFPDTEEKIELEITNNQFDLALRKFISSINGEDVSRWSKPQVDTSKLVTGESTTAEYYNAKQPLRICVGQEIIYTLRVYNEGQIAGYANKIVDYLPEQLEFLPDDEFNISRGWKYVETDKSLRTIETNYLSKEVNEQENLINAFNTETAEIDYVEVQVKCKVKPNIETIQLITNIAEITEYEGKDIPNVIDRDSSSLANVPSDEELPSYKQDEIDKKYVPGQEDDDDFEKVIVEEFDLSLKKWVSHTIVYENNTEKIVETGHTGDEKPEPVVKVDLGKNTLDSVVVKFKYQIKVTNEGVIPGYVKEISDYIPEGLRFEQSDNLTWKQVDGKVVTFEAANTLLQPGESTTVSIVLTWNNGRNNLGTKINIAEISDDYNDYGDTEDIDSTPNNKITGEDDIDTAPVILSIRTGERNVYIMLIISVVCFSVAGIVAINRFMFNKNNN